MNENATLAAVVIDGEKSCEVIATHEAARTAASPVSPAVSPPISPSTEENNKVSLTIDSDGNKCGSQSGSKANCYKCKHRRELAGDTHSSCGHPAASPAAAMLFMCGHTEFNIKQIHIRGNSHGVRSGWFCWPLNFDPVWLEICTGFEEIK